MFRSLAGMRRKKDAELSSIFKSYISSIKQSFNDENNVVRKVFDLINGSCKSRVRVGPSTIKGAGRGVFAESPVAVGDLVALYAGVYVPPPPIWTVGVSTGESPISLRDLDYHRDKRYVLHCSNHGGTLDAADHRHDMHDFQAVAQMMNHPSDGYKKNVVSYDFLWSSVLKLCSTANYRQQESLLTVISKINVMAKGPWYFDPVIGECVELHDQCAALVGCAFFASEFVESGSELFYDYKFEVNNRPDWY